MSLKNTDFILESAKERKPSQNSGAPAWEGPTQNQTMRHFFASVLGIGILVLGILIVLVLPSALEKEADGEADKPVTKSSDFLTEQAEKRGERGDFVASVNSDVFHWISCDYASNINKENRIYFKTTTEARQSGRRECSVCFFGTRHTPVSILNGEIVTSPQDDCLAPLSVTTRGDENYYVILDGTDQMSFYVKGGHTAEVDVPLGYYEIYYAVGKTWYGKDHLFGPETGHYKCDDYFRFYEKDGYVNGWNLELYLQDNGNLDTEPVDPDDFPDI